MHQNRIMSTENWLKRDYLWDHLHLNQRPGYRYSQQNYQFEKHLDNQVEAKPVLYTGGSGTSETVIFMGNVAELVPSVTRMSM